MGQRINREVMSQPILLVQKVRGKFLKSFTGARKCLLLTEVNVARNKFCVIVFIHAIIEKQILRYQIMRNDVHFRN